MKFARIVFWIAAIWGVLLLAPLYFIFDLIGRQDPPPITHPAFYYGFAGAGLAWQLAFIVIARDPLRFRAMMIPSIVEKFSYGLALTALFLQHRLHSQDFAFGAIDLLSGLLFVAAFLKTVIDNVLIRCFGTDVEFAQLAKLFEGKSGPNARYSPPRITVVISKVRIGRADPEQISTAYVERENLTMRMAMHRFTRLTNAFSKKLLHLKAAVALHFA